MTKDQEIRGAEAERWWQVSRDAMAYSKDYGTVAVNSLILVNGGALLALLSFLAASEVRDQLTGPAIIRSVYWTFFFFALGMGLALVTAGVGYLNYLWIAFSQPGPSDLSEYVLEGRTSGWTSHRGINITLVVGVGAATFSLGSFLTGCFFALTTITETLG
jgi:hypothetical protein